MSFFLIIVFILHIVNPFLYHMYSLFLSVLMNNASFSVFVVMVVIIL